MGLRRHSDVPAADAYPISAMGYICIFQEHRSRFRTTLHPSHSKSNLQKITPRRIRTSGASFKSDVGCHYPISAVLDNHWQIYDTIQCFNINAVTSQLSHSKTHTPSQTPRFSPSEQPHPALYPQRAHRSPVPTT
jgi:hypothetical protein